MTVKIKWGILGTSPISATLVHAIKASEYSELVAVAGRTSDKASKFADKFEIQKHYGCYQQLLNDSDVDAIYIGLPNHLHKDWIFNAARAGKHILCEKPLVLNAEEANVVFATVHAANVICMEALMYRYHPLTKKLQQLIKDNVIGEIKLMNATYTANIVNVANPEAGGSIRNLGCYPISLVRLLADCEPHEITAFGRLNKQTQHDSQASAILKFSSDLMAVVSTADDLEMVWQFDAYGTDGCLKMMTNPWMPTLNNKLVIERHGQKHEININAEKPLYTYQVDAMCKKIMNHQTDEITWQDSLGNVKVLENWYAQVQTNHSPPS